VPNLAEYKLTIEFSTSGRKKSEIMLPWSHLGGKHIRVGFEVVPVATTMSLIAFLLLNKVIGHIVHLAVS
jgi:hypothetical protein